MSWNPRRIVSAVALLAAAACGGSSPSSGVTLSARLGGAAAAAPGSGGVSLAGGRVRLDELWMVIRDIKLERPGLANEVNAANGPFLVHLAGAALQGGVTQEFTTVEVPAGTYDDLRFVVHKLEDLQQVGAPELDRTRASIAMSLTIDGTEAVLFTSELDAAQRIGGTFVVGEGGAVDNITLSIDPTRWFGDGAGFLDPRVGANRQAIEDAIQTSIDAFEDDDRNGLSDDGPNHT